MGTQDLVFLWLVLLATADCNWDPLTPCDDASKCRARSRPKSTSTKAQWTASRKLLQKRDWLQVCTKDLQQTFCAVWVVPWFWCSMTGRRLTSLFEERV